LSRRSVVPSALIDAIRAERIEVLGNVPGPDFSAVCGSHEKQREFVTSDAREINALGGRQGGKTFAVLCRQWQGAFDAPGSLNPYLALSSKSAKLITWPEVLRIASMIGLDSSCLHEHTQTVKFPNGSTWIAAGTDDMRTIESWRGVKTKRPAIDEMGSQPEDLIAYAVQEIFWPTMIRFGGQLTKVGTPRKICAGYWYDQTGPGRSVAETPPLYHWTAWDNPGLGGPEQVEAFVQEFLRNTGLSRDSPQFRREWLAEWVQDTTSLVFPVDINRNVLEKLPVRSRSGILLDPTRWRFGLGVDVGVVDATAIAVVAAHPDDPRAFIVSTEKHPRMLVTALRDRLRELRRKYKVSFIVLDAGGMGKYHHEELTKQWLLPIEQARKVEKESHVRDIRDQLQAGRVIILSSGAEGEDVGANDALMGEWAVLGWDEKGRLPNPSQEDHASDAVLYALRKLANYRESEVAPDIAPGTEAWYIAEQQRIREYRIQKYGQTRKATPWG
jgi:pimeloyl-ACP methyl ester carboxylesterase